MHSLHMADLKTPLQEGFRQVLNGRSVDLHILNAPGSPYACAITNYGARIVSLTVPGRDGLGIDIALGYSTLAQYLQQPEEYMGAIVGRCANRIAAGLFVLGGETCVLPVNDGPNTLHGGPGGFHAQVWDVAHADAHSLTLRYTSPDGEEGFPGTVEAEVQYSWKAGGVLQMAYRATTDKITLVNLSNHTYFNLSGEGADTILDHELQIAADAITSVDAGLIPTGAQLSVKNSPFDFLAPRRIGEQIDAGHEQLRRGRGYDHNFVLGDGGTAVMLRSPVTGISMRIQTNQPGLQFYSGNFLDGTRTGRSGKPYGRHSAVVLEPQGFPDAIHHPQFPGVVLKPGEEYQALSEYAFGLS